MRKLTKSIKKCHRLHYKPTIGITLPDGKRVSVNAVEYYVAVKAEEKRQVEAEMHRVAHKLIREMLPGVAVLEDWLAVNGAWGYYF